MKCTVRSAKAHWNSIPIDKTNRQHLNLTRNCNYIKVTLQSPLRVPNSFGTARTVLQAYTVR